MKIQLVFFFHLFSQMFAQVLMLVAVGAKIAYDNRDYDTNGNNPAVTGYLWYMLAAAYLLPIFGIGTFFIVYYYWTQQFLIGLCISFVKELQIWEDNHPFASGRDEKRSVAICRFVRINKLQSDYKELRETKYSEKNYLSF